MTATWMNDSYYEQHYELFKVRLLALFLYLVLFSLVFLFRVVDVGLDMILSCLMLSYHRISS